MHVVDDRRATWDRSEAGTGDGAPHQEPRDDQPAVRQSVVDWGQIPPASQGSPVDKVADPDGGAARGYGSSLPAFAL